MENGLTPPIVQQALLLVGPFFLSVSQMFSWPPSALACFVADVMYIHEAINDLVKTLAGLCDSSTVVYIAHGRNRQAGKVAALRLHSWLA